MRIGSHGGIRASDLLGLWRHPKRTMRPWAMVRRGWPKPADVEEMSPQEFDAYLRHIGFEDRIAAAVANANARAATEADARVRRS